MFLVAGNGTEVDDQGRGGVRRRAAESMPISTSRGCCAAWIQGDAPGAWGCGGGGTGSRSRTGELTPAVPSAPLLAAMTTGDGRQRVELRVPLAPFVGLGKTLQALQPPRPGRGPRPPAAQPPPTGGNTF